MNDDDYFSEAKRVSAVSRTEAPRPSAVPNGKPPYKRCFTELLLNAAMALPPLLSGLAALAHFSKSILLIVAIAIGVLGRAYLRRVRAREGDARYASDRRMRRLLRTARRFAMRWIGCGIGLGVFVLFVPAPFVASLLGVSLSLLTFINGLAVEGDIAAREERLKIVSARGSRGRTWADRIARMPLLRGAARLCPHRRPRVGDIGLGLAGMLLAVVCAATIFAGLAIGEGVVFVKNETGSGGAKEPKRRPPPPPSRAEKGGEVGPEGPPTYAELCPRRPNPLTIHHGLGWLFRRAGALITGCGRRERSVSDLGAIWYSEGICSGELRSLAVISPDYAPVVLFGESAVFARHAAREGELLFADVAEPGGGVVYAVGTASGTFFFVASVPAVGPVPESAVYCAEVPTNPLTELSPAMAARWLCQVERTGWAWPVVDANGSIAFLDDNMDELVEGAACEEVPACKLGTDCEVTGEVTLTDLAEYMPVHLA